MATDVEALVLQIEANTNKLAKQMASVRLVVDNSLKSVEDRAKQAGQGFDVIGTRAAASYNKAAAGALKAAQSAGALKAQTANIAAQFQDIAVQLQSGANPFTVAMQQGTQLGAVFTSIGGAGAVVRGIGSAFASVLSPVNLATIALIAAGGAAVKYFTGASGTEELSGALKAQPEIIKAIRDAWGDAAAAAADYSKESDKVVAAMVERQKETLAKGIKAASETTVSSKPGNETTLSSFMSGTASLTSNLTGQVAQLPVGMKELSTAIDALKQAADDPSGMLEFRDALADITKMSGVADHVRDMANGLLETTNDAGEAARRLLDLSNAQVQATSSIRSMVNETKIFNDLLSNGDYSEAAQHAQTLGQALNAAAAAQKALNTEMSRFASEHMQDWGSRYENLNDFYQRQSAGISGETYSPSNGLLDLIAQAEGTGSRRNYNETLDYGKWTGGNQNLVLMTLDEIDALQSRMLANPENRATYDGIGSSALGRYQITRSTLRDLRSQLGLKGSDYFSPELQDRLAEQLIRESGNDPTRLQGVWEGLKKVPTSTISSAFDVSSTSLGGKDQALAQQATAYDNLIKKAQEYIATQKSEASTVSLTGEAASKMKHEQELLNQAQQAGIQLTPQQKEQLSQLATQMAAAEQGADRLAQAQQAAKEQEKYFAETAADALSDIIVNGKSATDVIASLSKSLAEAALKAVLLGEGPLASLFGTASASGATGGLFGKLFSWIASANGNVFSSPGLHAYANSVVSKPTTFAFAAGAGLMGEAGPEAIMPLRRDGLGRLGVMAKAAGSQNNISFGDINVSVPEGTDTRDAARIGNEFRRQLTQIIDKRMTDQSRTGGILAKGVFA